MLGGYLLAFSYLCPRKSTRVMNTETNTYKSLNDSLFTNVNRGGGKNGFYLRLGMSICGFLCAMGAWDTAFFVFLNQ